MTVRRIPLSFGLAARGIAFTKFSTRYVHGHDARHYGGKCTNLRAPAAGITVKLRDAINCPQLEFTLDRANSGKCPLINVNSIAGGFGLG